MEQIIYDYTWVRSQDLTSKEIKFIYTNLCMHPNIYIYIYMVIKKIKNKNLIPIHKRNGNKRNQLLNKPQLLKIYYVYLKRKKMN